MPSDRASVKTAATLFMVAAPGLVDEPASFGALLTDRAHALQVAQDMAKADGRRWVVLVMALDPEGAAYDVANLIPPDWTTHGGAL